MCLFLVWLVVANIFYFYPLPGEIIKFDKYFSDGLKPPTSFPNSHTVFQAVCVDPVQNVSVVAVAFVMTLGGHLWLEFGEGKSS